MLCGRFNGKRKKLRAIFFQQKFKFVIVKKNSIKNYFLRFSYNYTEFILIACPNDFIISLIYVIPSHVINVKKNRIIRKKRKNLIPHSETI